MVTTECSTQNQHHHLGIKDLSKSGIIGLNWFPKLGIFEINLKMGGDKLETNENILKILLLTVLVKIGMFLHRFDLQRCFNHEGII